MLYNFFNNPILTSRSFYFHHNVLMHGFKPSSKPESRAISLALEWNILWSFLFLYSKINIDWTLKLFNSVCFDYGFAVNQLQFYIIKIRNIDNIHWVKRVRIWNFSNLYFPAFGLNRERYSVSLHIQFECGKIGTRITRNTDSLLHSDSDIYNYQKNLIALSQGILRFSRCC